VSRSWEKFSDNEAAKLQVVANGETKEQEIAKKLTFVLGDSAPFLGFNTVYALHSPSLSHEFHISLTSTAEKMKTLGASYFVEVWENFLPEKKKIQAAFQVKVKKAPSNADGKPSVIPAYFSSSTEDAWRICGSGFTKSHMIQGNFGFGLYLTTDLQHCPKNEGIVVVMVNVGNVHPVVESPNGEFSLENKAPRPSHNSYYALVNSGTLGGSLPYDGEGTATDELIIFDESRVLPMFFLQSN